MNMEAKHKNVKFVEKDCLYSDNLNETRRARLEF